MDASRVFTLAADHVALDFVNTLDDRFVPEQQTEKLESYADLLGFAEQAKVLTTSQAASLAKAAQPGLAVSVWRLGVEWRELLARIFYAVAQGQAVAKGDLEAFNDSLRRAARQRVLSADVEGFQWRWEGLEQELEAPLWPVMQAAADLLVSPQLPFVRACARASCRWLFLDSSKNHSRRWCDMKVCGNRVKASRYYALHGRE